MRIARRWPRVQWVGRTQLSRRGQIVALCELTIFACLMRAPPQIYDDFCPPARKTFNEHVPSGKATSICSPMCVVQMHGGGKFRCAVGAGEPYALDAVHVTKVCGPKSPAVLARPVAQACAPRACSSRVSRCAPSSRDRRRRARTTG